MEEYFLKYNLKAKLTSESEVDINIDLRKELTSLQITTENELDACLTTLDRIKVYKTADRMQNYYLSIIYGIEYGCFVYYNQTSHNLGLAISITSIPISARLKHNELIYMTVKQLWNELTFVPRNEIRLYGINRSKIILPHSIKTKHVRRKTKQVHGHYESFLNMYTESENTELSWI